VPATSRSSPKKQVGSIRATCRDCENEEGPQWIEREETFRARGSSAVRIDREEAGRYGEREAWIKERIGASIARKQVDTANARHGSERGSEPRGECDQSRLRGSMCARRRGSLEAKGTHNQ
jgi:hypothetical protein